MINRQKKGLRYSEVYKLRAEVLLKKKYTTKYMNVSRIKEYVFPALIILICGILAWKNYVPNTILSGWDTLHPEFNLWLYFKRALNGVWMEHQGLGAVASQSHPAEIPRLLVYGLLELILPSNLARYSYLFLCLTFGALGVYYFSKYILSIKWNKYVKASSFLASLFYIFNLTTVQQFYVPLEMFAVHYALVPWLFLFGLRYIREKNKKILIWFSIITLFASSMAHTATLFYIYLVSLGLFLVFQNFKKAFFLCLITVLINSFWILPNLYYIKNHSAEVSISKIHSNFTDEAFMQSQSFGDFENLSLSKNFLFNWGEYNFKENKFVNLLDEWKLHLEKPYVKEIGYSLFGIAILGLFVAIVFRSWQVVALSLPFFLSVFFWINENPPFTNIFTYLKDNFPLIKEGLRFPFTKFSMIYILVSSIWFGFASRLIINLLSKIKLGFLYILVVVVAIFYFQLPQFQGYLISPSMKVAIPSNYTDAFNWLNKQDESSRVAKLPLNSYWGWVYNDWGYQGAGFTWFGIKQPILEREFDRWSQYNETFYSEAARAVSDRDNQAFQRIVNKYQVKYLLLDESIINPGGEKIEVMDLGFDKVFNSGFLTIYDTHFISNNFISSLNSYTSINADLTYSKVDPIYQKYGDYVQDENGLGLPFVNFDTRGPVEIRIGSEELIISNTKQNAKVTLPVIEKITEDFDPSRGYSEVNNCDLMKKGEVERSQQATGRQYMAKNGGVACDYFVYENLKYNQAYVMHVKGENREGRSLKIYLYNWESKRVEIEELLPVGQFDSYFVIYPKTQNSGYTLNIETRSFGRITSENSINTIEFIPFDINLVQNLYIEPKQQEQQGLTLQSNLVIKNIKKYGTAIYKVETTGSGILELGQGYESGWISYPKLEHLKVNGWANGWVLNANSLQSTDYSSAVSGRPSTVVIFYWPQFLEWFGFVVLCIVVVSLVFGSVGNKEANY